MNYAMGYTEGGDRQVAHVTSKGSHHLLYEGGSAYYLETHHNIWGHKTVLYRIVNDKVKEIATFRYYGYFAGTYNRKIIIRLVKSSYTNYPIDQRYILYDPITGQMENMPLSIENMVCSNEQLLLNGYDNNLLIKMDNSLYSYDPVTDKIEPVDENPFEFISLASTFCFVKRNNEPYLIYYADNSVQIAKASEEISTQKIHLPGTHCFYGYVADGKTMSFVRYNILKDTMDSLTEEHLANASILILSLDANGEYIYAVTGTDVKRYDLQTDSLDQDFIYHLNISGKDYIDDITVYEDRIVYLVHSNAKNELIIDSLNPQCLGES